MPLQVKSFFHDVEAGGAAGLRPIADNGAERPVLRAIMLKKPDETQYIEKFDAVFCGFSQHGYEMASLAAAAEEKGASVLVVAAREICPCRDGLCGAPAIPLWETADKTELTRVYKALQASLSEYEAKCMNISYAFQNVLYFHHVWDDNMAALESFGWNRNRTCCAAVMIFRCREEKIDADMRLDHLEKYLEAGVNFPIRRATVIRAGCQISMVFDNCDEETVSGAVMEALDVVPEAIRQRYEIYIGVGKTADGADELHESFLVGTRAAMMQMRRGQDGVCLSYREMGIAKLLMHISDDSVAADFYRETLQPLAEYDARNFSDMMHFLRVYFEEGCSIKDTAEKLYMHRNSVNYKLRKIEDILGCSVSDINKRTEILIAFKLAELMDLP